MMIVAVLYGWAVWHLVGTGCYGLAAGSGGSKHRHENDDSDTTAPSSPALKAEDDSSVSVELPGDANKGDTVDVATSREMKKGGKPAVMTLEKGITAGHPVIRDADPGQHWR